MSKHIPPYQSHLLKLRYLHATRLLREEINPNKTMDEQLDW